MQKTIMCGEDEYREFLFSKFVTASVMTLIVKLLQEAENPDEIREVLIKTWYDKCLRERADGMAEVKNMVEDMIDSGEEIPEQLSEESLEMQEQFFNGMMQELSCEIRALLKLPGSNS